MPAQVECFAILLTFLRMGSLARLAAGQHVFPKPSKNVLIFCLEFSIETG
jgi:hypothetical protein